MLRILQLPDTTPPLLPTAICLSGRIGFHACQSIQRHSTLIRRVDIRQTTHLCCVVCFTENEEGGWGVLKGDSTLVRGQTDGLCVGYLQPGGGWGNLAVVVEVRSQGSRAKAPQNVIKIKCKRRLRGGFCRWCAQESCHFYAVSLIHSLYQFVIQGEEAWPARLIRPRAEKLAFFFLFFPERPEERMNS